MRPSMETDRLQWRLDAILLVSVLNLGVLVAMGVKYAPAETVGLVVLSLLIGYALIRN
jgi:hypothetical protein